MNQKDKILIIGASSDVGAELARIFAQKGSDLLLTKRGIEDLEPLRKDLMIRYNINVDLVNLEATDYASHKLLIEPLLENINDVFCFIGYLGDQKKAENDWSEAERIIDLNFKGVVSILNVVANAFEIRKKGNITGISSVAGNRGRQSNYFYGSSKAALTAYLSGMRNRLFKSNVHVMTVLPGFMKTKMTAHLELPPMLTATPEIAASLIYRGHLKKKSTIYVLPVWRYIMMIIVHLPEFIFKKLSL